MEARTIIEAGNLTKKYGDLTAVDSISFGIRERECFGFLGPNGAGKTTTMKMITCISPVTGGELWIDGKDVRRDRRAIKSVLGVVSQADSLDPDLTVMQNLISYCRFFNLPKETAILRSRQALELFQLSDRASRKPDELSGGMRRRLLIARALLHEPKVLVLDEPTTGLDPQTRLLVWEKLQSLKAEGITILLTTHYMDEASYLCDRLVVMDEGRILVEGPPKDLIQQLVGDQVFEVQVGMGDKARLMDRLHQQEVDFDDRGYSVFLFGGIGRRPPDVEDLDINGHQIIRRPGNLEDVFLKLTGRGLREE